MDDDDEYSGSGTEQEDPSHQQHPVLLPGLRVSILWEGQTFTGTVLGVAAGCSRVKVLVDSSDGWEEHEHEAEVQDVTALLPKDGGGRPAAEGHKGTKRRCGKCLSCTAYSHRKCENPVWIPCGKGPLQPQSGGDGCGGGSSGSSGSSGSGSAVTLRRLIEMVYQEHPNSDKGRLPLSQKDVSILMARGRRVVNAAPEDVSGRRSSGDSWQWHGVEQAPQIGWVKALLAEKMDLTLAAPTAAAGDPAPAPPADMMGCASPPCKDGTGNSTGEEDPHVAAMMCEKCGGGGDEDRMVLCDKCDRGWHIWCLNPKLDDIPAGNWFCEECTPIMAHFPMHLIPLPVRRTRIGPEFQLQHIPDNVGEGQLGAAADARNSTKPNIIDEQAVENDELVWAPQKSAGCDSFVARLPNVITKEYALQVLLKCGYDEADALRQLREEQSRSIVGSKAAVVAADRPSAPQQKVWTVHNCDLGGEGRPEYIPPWAQPESFIAGEQVEVSYDCDRGAKWLSGTVIEERSERGDVLVTVHETRRWKEHIHSFDKLDVRKLGYKLAPKAKSAPVPDPLLQEVEQELKEKRRNLADLQNDIVLLEETVKKRKA